MKYRYDIEEHALNKKVKVLATDLTGAVLKTFLKSIDNSTNVRSNKIIKVFKTSIKPNGKSTKVEYKVIPYGIEVNIQKVFAGDFKYVINCDYGYYNPCMHGSDCCDNDMCRCGEITNPVVSSTNGFSDYVLNKLIKISKLYKSTLNPDILNYCLERVIEYRADITPKSFDINVCSSYYGEEIGSVKYQASKELTDTIADVIKAPSALDAVKMILEMEYGFLLEESKDYKACKVKSVKRSQLVTPNEYHAKILDKNYVKKYKEMDYDIPIGIYRKVNDKYEIIDGYHRFCAASANKKTKVKIILITKGA